MSILDSFPANKKPRQVQIEALELVETNWNKSDVFVIEAPTAAGKSALAVTLARWVHKTKDLKSNIITPENLLVNQYIADYPKLASLFRRDSYMCKNSADLSCSEQQSNVNLGGYCKGCTYVKSLRKMYGVPYSVANYYIYLAHKLYRPVLIIDEAHRTVNMLQDWYSTRIWKHDIDYPADMETREDLVTWLESIRRNEFLEDLYQDLKSYKFSYVVEHGTAPYFHVPKPCLNIYPIDVRKQKPVLWPGNVRKIIMLSSTINSKDIENLGLDGRRVMYINCNSPIPADRRPVQYIPVADMRHEQQEEELPRLIEFIDHIINQESGRGIIHTTYSLSKKLKEILDHPRLLWHTASNKKTKLQEFLDSENGVLIACGMQEGIDLVEDKARWQIITKVPWPNLSSIAIRVKAEQDRTWYAWEATKAIIQASGRICRTPTDFGMTYIIDKSFETLYSNHSELFPAWYQAALH